MGAALKIYDELADWFHLLTAPEDYADEAAAYRDAFLAAGVPRGGTLLELGSGGGNNASFLKRDFICTLSDLSPRMLELSRTLNPECDHLEGDMRALRLGREFDAVFVHDALMYLVSEDDLQRAIETAFLHCRAGGAALFAPDCVRETFEPRTDCGGHDGLGRALRYLEWTWDPDPEDNTFIADFAIILREGYGIRVIQDRHVEGLFPRATWLRLLGEAGFQVSSSSRRADDGSINETFVAKKP